jgi:hypothetical protein
MKFKILANLFFITSLSAFGHSCEEHPTQGGASVDVYLFNTYQTIPGKCQIEPTKSVLQDTAFIKNQDIIAYSATGYTFELTASALEKIKSLKDNMPFAVTLDKQVVYYGFFKPLTSSSSCEHSITMDFDWASNNKILLTLGYPSHNPDNNTIDDQRNNTKLIATLKNQGKLK